MSQLTFSLLGSPQALVEEQPVTVESRKALALLYYLAVTGEPHSRDHLATLFWPEQDQSQARASLRHVLWLLKKAGLEPWLAIERDALALQGEYGCDVPQFRQQIEAGQLNEALSLYRDDFLTGFTLRDCPEFDQWQFLQADALRHLLASALETLMHQCAEQGKYAAALEHAHRWLSLDPLHELVHRHLMQLYALVGQQAAALRQYEECVRLLDDELGVPPAEETMELYRAIKTRQFPPSSSALTERHQQSEQAAAPPPAVSTPSPVHNLPAQLTPFVGRESEVTELAQLLADPTVRLVTITGFGGIGKTRLALQVAGRFVEDAVTPFFVHGVLFVPLNAVENTDGLVSAIAAAGGFNFYSNLPPRQQLLDYLRDKKMLLLLDNFEHLLPSADLVSDMLITAPDVTILVTSREPLNLQGEWHWPVAGLPFPAEEVDAETLLSYDAVRLFVQSARRVQPNFSPAEEQKEIVRICQLVGGMPLGIELAAAWLKMVPCAQIAAEIERNLAFLTTRLRDVPERHRSIQAVFEHSWGLLSSAEQAVFQQLSVFRGGFQREAVEQITHATWSDLAALVEKSLLSVNPTGRYQIHELLRQYGAAKLQADPAAAEAARSRHCCYFADFLHERLQPINGFGQRQTLAEITPELDNVHVAWQWAIEQRSIDEIRKCASTFYFFCQLQSRFLEGADALNDAATSLETLEPSAQRDLTLANVLNHQGWLRIRVGEFERAAAVLEQSRALYAQRNTPPPPIMGGDSSVPLAIVCLIRGEHSRAVDLGEEARRTAEDRNDKHNLSFAHYVLTAAELAQGHYEAAYAHAQQACTFARAVGTRWFLAYALNEWGNVARAMGNYAEAKNHFQASYAIKEEFADPEGMAVALNHLGEIAMRQADNVEAQRLFQKSLAIYRAINDRGGLATSLKGLGQIACVRREYAAARQLFAGALTIVTEIQFWPLVFATLLDVSDLLMQTDAQSLGIEVLTLVQRHPASDFETRTRADEQLRQWQSEVDSELFAGALNRATERTLDTVVTAIFAELAAHAETAAQPHEPVPME